MAAVVAVIGFALGGAAAPEAAGALQARGPAPGFYRMSLGRFHVVALNDGVIPYRTAQLLPNAPADRIEKGLFAMGLTDPFGMSYNAYLVDTGDKVVLIDTGTGGKMADSPFFRGAGRLLTNLRAAGYQPEHVDEIYITHLGPDHVGGLTQGDRAAFPNAIVRAARREVDILTSSAASRPGASEELIGFWRGLFEPYVAAGRFQTFDRDTTLTPGIRAIGTPGHTPGHTSYVIESDGQRLIVLGDLVLVAAMQFADPSLESSFDADRPAAALQRRRVLEMAVRENLWVGGAHLSFPGLGHVRAGGAGFRFVPAHWAIPE